MAETDPLTLADIARLKLRSDAPLLVVDVDEVLALFVSGFERFVGGHGLEMRFDRFGLLHNLFRPGEAAHLPLERGRELLERYFDAHVELAEPTPGAADALAILARHADVVLLTTAPEHSRHPRSRWLARHGFDYPQVLTAGLKGPVVARLAAETRGPVVFIDDLLNNLDSAADHAPAVQRFQLVADPRLRASAPCAPDRHRRIDDWDVLGRAIAEAIETPRKPAA